MLVLLGPETGDTQTAGRSWGAARLWSWSPRPTGLFSVDDRERWRVLLAWADLGIKEKTAPGLSSYQPEKEREGIREARGDISCSHLSSGAWEQEMLEAVVRGATGLLNLASSPLPLDFGANERTEGRNWVMSQGSWCPLPSDQRPQRTHSPGDPRRLRKKRGLLSTGTHGKEQARKNWPRWNNPFQRCGHRGPEQESTWPKSHRG